MKIKHLIKLFLLILCITFSISSCKDKKNDTETKVTTPYKCPMNCENGKTYNKPGICPACKMDLTLVVSDETITCETHQVGNCKCEGYKCACTNCEKHSKPITCETHKDGNCKCEGDKCSCANCKEHS